MGLEDGNEIRTKGNKLIQKLFESSGIDGELYDVSSFNRKDGIQKTLVASEEIINDMLDNRGKKGHWPFISPFSIRKSQFELINVDGANGNFLEDAYKGKAVLTTMKPQNFLYFSSPLITSDESEKVIKRLTTVLESPNGEMDTPNLSVRGDKVINHEGRHRAIAAIKAGIKEMPVYLYFKESLPDLRRERYVKNSVSFLTRQDQDAT